MTGQHAPPARPAGPEVSVTTIPVAGLLIDVYGLDELPADAPITCLWLLHPRTHDRAKMRDVARRTLDASHRHEAALRQQGLLALAFDLPNHGTRMANMVANLAWDEGNENHALDMMGMIKEAKQDLSALMNLIEGYLGRGRVERHMALGWSLGGHSVWQAWFDEARLDAAVVIVGCPDFSGLMEHRISLRNDSSSRRAKVVPPGLLEDCLSHDPKRLLFNSAPVPALPLSSLVQDRLRPILDSRIRGKRMLVCSGASDALVPYAVGKPFLDMLKEAVGKDGWYADGGVAVEDRVYAGVGHDFSSEMVGDAVKWLVEAAAQGPSKSCHRPSQELYGFY